MIIKLISLLVNRKDHDREIEESRASIRQNSQAIESGSRVVKRISDTMSGMIDLVAGSPENAP